MLPGSCTEQPPTLCSSGPSARTAERYSLRRRGPDCQPRSTTNLTHFSPRQHRTINSGEQPVGQVTFISMQLIQTTGINKPPPARAPSLSHLPLLQRHQLSGISYLDCRPGTALHSHRLCPQPGLGHNVIIKHYRLSGWLHWTTEACCILTLFQHHEWVFRLIGHINEFSHRSLGGGAAWPLTPIRLTGLTSSME